MQLKNGLLRIFFFSQSEYFNPTSKTSFAFIRFDNAVIFRIKTFCRSVGVAKVLQTGGFEMVHPYTKSERVTPAPAVHLQPDIDDPSP